MRRGRPRITVEVRRLIRQMYQENPTWGALIFGEHHLRRVQTEYVRYYNESRTHMSLDGNSPIPRRVEPPSKGDVVAIPFLGGLHHRYTRAA